MRCYQHIGLKKEARDYLKKNVSMVPSQVCPKCGEVISEKENIKKSIHEDLFYGDGPTLNTYLMKDGSEVSEILQDSPWSSGPMGFVCLEKGGKRLFKWSDKEIQEML